MIEVNNFQEMNLAFSKINGQMVDFKVETNNCVTARVFKEVEIKEDSLSYYLGEQGSELGYCKLWKHSIEKIIVDDDLVIFNMNDKSTFKMGIDMDVEEYVDSVNKFKYSYFIKKNMLKLKYTLIPKFVTTCWNDFNSIAFTYVLISGL
jgi:hypothetical protein